MKKISKAGFTLIELLIVVAIIAILAAIAVPNLRGTNRLKADADMRTTAVALESYYVDYNRCPRGCKVDMRTFPWRHQSPM